MENVHEVIESENKEDLLWSDLLYSRKRLTDGGNCGNNWLFEGGGRKGKWTHESATR